MGLPADFLNQFDEPFGFLDFASVGALSIPARRKLNETAQAMAGDQGRLVPFLLGGVADVQRQAAHFLGLPAEQVVIQPNTSAGLFAVAFGLSGGSVVVPRGEFPANLYPWVRAEQAGRIRLRLVDSVAGRITPELFRSAIDDRTVAVAFSAVDYHTGFRADLAAIREVAGDALVVVDAVQGLGALDLPWDQADVLVAGGHKWLRAGLGAGLMAVSPRALERLAPTLTGWPGVEDPFAADLPLPHPALEGASRFMMGTPPALAAAGLAGSLQALEMVEMAHVHEAVLNRSQEIEAGLRRIGAEILAPGRGPAERSGIVTFRPTGETSNQAHVRLQQAGFMVTERNGWIRVAPHATTHPEAAGALVEVLAHQPKWFRWVRRLRRLARGPGRSARPPAEVRAG